MGLASGIEAAQVAKQIIHDIDIWIKKATQQETLDALNELRTKAVEIKEAGESGWW